MLKFLILTVIGEDGLEKKFRTSFSDQAVQKYIEGVKAVKKIKCSNTCLYIVLDDKRMYFPIFAIGHDIYGKTHPQDTGWIIETLQENRGRKESWAKTTASEEKIMTDFAKEFEKRIKEAYEMVEEAKEAISVETKWYQTPEGKEYIRRYDNLLKTGLEASLKIEKAWQMALEPNPQETSGTERPLNQSMLTQRVFTANNCEIFAVEEDDTVSSYLRTTNIIGREELNKKNVDNVTPLIEAGVEFNEDYRRFALTRTIILLFQTDLDNPHRYTDNESFYLHFF